MNTPARPTLRFPWAALAGLFLLSGSLFVSTGCVYVRLRTDLEEGRWLDEILDDVHETPASFRRGETNLQFRDLFCWDRQGKLEMDFECDPDELAEYLHSVGLAIEHEIVRRDGEVVSIEETGPLARTYAYDGERSGVVNVEIETGRDTHRLVLDWEEDGWAD